METLSEGSVLGVTYFGPVEGSPLIPPQLLTIYFVIFLILLSTFYIVLYLKKRPVTLWHKFKLLSLTALALKIFLIGGLSLLAFYWLVPKPSVVETSPAHRYQHFSPTSKVEIIFDRPVARSELEKSIFPDIPGRWVFEDSLYTTHLYRKLVFYPTYSFKPDTNYQITLSKIKSITKLSSPYTFQLDFKTQKVPQVLSVEPVSGQENVEIDSQIKVTLSKPNHHISQFDFELSPSIELEAILHQSKLFYSLKPRESLKQGVKYSLTVKKTDVILNLQEAAVAERGPTTLEYDGAFETRQAPGIKSFEPLQTTNVAPNSSVQITFSQDMDKKSVEENFAIEPKIPGAFSWIDNATVVFQPDKLDFETQYSIKIATGTKSAGAGFIEQDIIKSFKTIGSVKVTNINPTDGWSAVSIHSPVKIAFDQIVDKTSAQAKFSITPEIPGKFSWNGNVMTYTPDSPLSFSKTYKVTLAKGIESKFGLSSKDQFSALFTTQDTTTKLAVPAYLQKYALSCELAALRMALLFRGIEISEDTLLSQVGIDSTPHQGELWGNPHAAFVGNVRGKQMVDGYGVHWDPIATVAKSYRGAISFAGWSIAQLTEALSLGNPVIVWVYSSGGWPTHWFTPEGSRIYAVRDEHAVTVVGFVGSSNNPSQIIVNDPLVGQVYWSRNIFDKKWDIFGRSGVVIN